MQSDVVVPFARLIAIPEPITTQQNRDHTHNMRKLAEETQFMETRALGMWPYDNVAVEQQAHNEAPCTWRW